MNILTRNLTLSICCCWSLSIVSSSLPEPLGRLWWTLLLVCGVFLYL
jgi:hypothetical protein